MKAAAAEYLGEDVSGSGDALTGRASDTDTEGLTHESLSNVVRIFSVTSSGKYRTQGSYWQAWTGGKCADTCGCG
jgi:hypothetical protein